jgi:hypothetical protein
MEIANKEIISELEKEVSTLQVLIQKYDPIEIMHRAAHMLLPLFLKYHSEYEFTSEESYFLPTVEYLQYLISRTPPNSDGLKFDELEWKELWAIATKVLNITQHYLVTRRTISSPPTEIDSLRFFLEGRRLMIRVRRYPIYFADHLRDSLSQYDDAIRDAYGIEVAELIQGLEQINSYQKEGVLGRYQTYQEANEAIIRKLREHGFSVAPSEIQKEGARIMEILKTPEFETLYKDVEEKARPP